MSFSLPAWFSRALLAGVGLSWVAGAHAQFSGSSQSASSPAAGPIGSTMSDPFTDSLDSAAMRRTRMPRGMIFFPPFPPPLDTAVNRNLVQSSAPGRGPSTIAPGPLADYVGEFFYPQLSNLMAEQMLTEKQRAHLVDYRTLKLNLLKDLRATLIAQEAAEPAARKQVLATLAAQQAPKLAELDKKAEALRSELIASERNWSDFREWKLGQKESRGFSPIEIAQVMRAYAHYQKGLLPAQRRLLREIVLDLTMAVEENKKTTTVQSNVFFAPAPARIALPADLPEEVAAKFAAYQTKKSLLKKELYDAVFSAESKLLPFGNPFSALAAKQSAQLRELDVLAEEIRVAIDPFVSALLPSLQSPLPPSFTARTIELLQRRDALQRTAGARVQEVSRRQRSTIPPVAVNYRFDNDRLRVQASPLYSRTAAPSQTLADRVEEAQQELNAIADDYGRGFAELVNERDALRREIGTAMAISDPVTIDRMMTQAMRASIVQSDELAYRDYRIATLSPGLSPEQRCLLFDGAVEALALPLPRGEMQPVRRADSW